MRRLGCELGFKGLGLLFITDICLRIKEDLRKKFAKLANDFEQKLHSISSELASISGPLEVTPPSFQLKFLFSLKTIQDQQQHIQLIQTRLPALSDALSTVKNAEAECVAANVEENDYTVFTCQDLEFELELVVHAVGKKIVFIDNQV